VIKQNIPLQTSLEPNCKRRIPGARTPLAMATLNATNQNPPQGFSSGDGDTLATTIATGTQDLSALAGLFCTDSVERSLLAIQYGYCAVAASSLSILGILGVVKSFLKLVIGLDRARNAGFSLDTIRPLLGYGPGESPAAGDLIDCNSVSVDFRNPAEVRIKVSKHRYDSITTPALRVGSTWGSTLTDLTVVNLGDPDFDRDIRQQPRVIALICLVSPGINAWLLLLVPYKWTWLKVIAIPVLHLCLFIMTVIPIVYCWENQASGKHIRAGDWRTLNEPIPSIKMMRFLQAKVYNGDVLHFQARRDILSSKWMRSLGFVISVVTSGCYVAQYAILKQASNERAIKWVSCQAFLALLRVLFWAWDPGFDNIGGNRAKFVMVNNTASPALTVKEILCGMGARRGIPELPVQNTAIPRWAWDYLITRPFQQIIKDALPPGAMEEFKLESEEGSCESDFEDDEAGEDRGEIGEDQSEENGSEEDIQTGGSVEGTGMETAERIPWGAEYCALLDIDFDVIMRKRLGGYPNRAQIAVEDWRLCLWRDKSKPDEIHPIILICIPITRMTQIKVSPKPVAKSVQVWFQAVSASETPCLEFAVLPDNSASTGSKNREHIRGPGGAICSAGCEISRDTPLYFRDDTHNYLRDRSYCIKLGVVSAIDDLQRYSVNTWDADVCMGATTDTIEWDEGDKETRWGSLEAGVKGITCFIKTRGMSVEPKSEDP